MDDFRQNKSKKSEDSCDIDNSDYLNITPDGETFQKLKADNFHLRLRCYNLEQELIKCTCFRSENEISKKEFYDQRTELSNVMQLHQNMCTENKRLSEENKLLQEKCGGLNDDFEKKLNDYEYTKIKCDQLSGMIKFKGLSNELIENIMTHNDNLIKSNVSLKLKIQKIEKKLSVKNKSFVEDQGQFKMSLAKSLSKIFKDTNESSFHNMNTTIPTSCIQCDELKVYSDKLSETIIRMSVDLQTITKKIEQKDSEILFLENDMLALNIDKDLFHKYKVVTKQTLRKYDQEKTLKEVLKKDHEELIEFYIKQLGEIRSENDHLKKKINESELLKKKANESELKQSKGIQAIENKIAEIYQVNDQLSFLAKSANFSKSDHYYEVGQYSPQYKIRIDPLHDQTVDSDLDSTYYNKNISFNDTAFRSMNEESCSYEDAIKQEIEHMKRKMRELGEVVTSYSKMMKAEKRKNSIVSVDLETSSKTQNMSNKNQNLNTLERSSSRDDESFLRKIYEEEKCTLTNILKEKDNEIEDLINQIKVLVEEGKEVEKAHKLRVKDMSSEYSDMVSEYREKINELNNKVEYLNNKMEQNDDVLSEVNKINENLKDNIKNQIEDFNDKVTKLSAEILSLHDDNFRINEALCSANEKVSLKDDDLVRIFQKIKNIIVAEPDLFPLNVLDNEINSYDFKCVWQMLGLIEQGLEERHMGESSAQSAASWKETQESNNIEIEDSINSLKTKENNFYTASLKLRRPGDYVEGHLLDLTNITDPADEEVLPEMPQVLNEKVKDKYIFIKENPELIHTKMKFYYNTCMRLKDIVKKKHEQNKRLNQTFNVSVSENLNEMSKQIDDFKLRLSQYRHCLEKSWSRLPEEVAEELLKLNLI